MRSVSKQQFAGGRAKAPEDATRAAEKLQLLHGVGICKRFDVRMGFGFLSMTARAGVALDPAADVFVHQSKLHMEGFRSLKESEAVEFTFKKLAKGLESIRVTGPGGVFCIGSESLLEKSEPEPARIGDLTHSAQQRRHLQKHIPKARLSGRVKEEMAAVLLLFGMATTI
ncbi:Protein Lin-28 A [Manis pentadactyla]|nr:Protein Lin-28 A [Manis pentadactyla]